MAELPSQDLELKAAEERRQLHFTAVELRSRLQESLDIDKRAREHLGMLTAAAALMGLAVGYSLTGIFVRS